MHECWCWRFHRKASSKQGRTASQEVLAGEHAVLRRRERRQAAAAAAAIGPRRRRRHRRVAAAAAVPASGALRRSCHGKSPPHALHMLYSTTCIVVTCCHRRVLTRKRTIASICLPLRFLFQVLHSSSVELSHYFPFLFKFILLVYAILCLGELLHRWSNGCFLNLWCAWRMKQPVQSKCKGRLQLAKLFLVCDSFLHWKSSMERRLMLQQMMMMMMEVLGRLFALRF